MGFYHDRILPHLIHLAMRNRELERYRKRVISAAEGRVLEIGVGSGLNLPFYRDAVREVIGLDPMPRLLLLAGQQAQRCARPVELIRASAESIPLDRHDIDTVVTTWTLCSIPNASVALGEMRRVLKPAGKLVFVEHGRADEIDVRRWQDRLDPLWTRLAGGCHLNRSISDLIAGAGFEITQLDTGYMKGPRPMTFQYEGLARPV